MQKIRTTIFEAANRPVVSLIATATVSLLPGTGFVTCFALLASQRADQAERGARVEVQTR